MSVPKVSIIEYGVGNVWSVMSAFKYLGADPELICDPDKIVKSSIIVLPGVGSFRRGMQALRVRGLDEAIIASAAEGSCILGICLGMQLMGSVGYEDGQTGGLGLIDKKVECFKTSALGERKIPHVGFDSISIKSKKGIFRGLPDAPDFYFTHSFFMNIDNIRGCYATCSYGIEFLAAFEIDNIFGAQFHPEKSQTNGLILLRNFLNVSNGS